LPSYLLMVLICPTSVDGRSNEWTGQQTCSLGINRGGGTGPAVFGVGGR